MKNKPIHLFSENNKIKIEKLLISEKNRELYSEFGLIENTKAVILWKSGKKIILKIGENKLALSERAAENILASLI